MQGHRAPWSTQAPRAEQEKWAGGRVGRERKKKTQMFSLDIPRSRTRSPAGPQGQRFSRPWRLSSECILQESRPLEEDKAAVGRRVPLR